MIVLNENEWAFEMIQTNSLGKKPYETLCRVAKYYASVEGRSKRDVRRVLEDFLIRCKPDVSVPKWSDTLDRAVSHAFKYSAIAIDAIEITKPEMEIIDSLGNSRQLKRLAFTLLCLSKYWDCVIPDGNHWVNSKDSEIMSMANVNTSIRRQSLMYHTLKEEGLLQFSRKVDNTNVRVLFQKEGEVALRVTDLRNLGYQYLMYHGEPYFVCENCGLTTKDKDVGVPGRKRKYCPDCATKMHIQNTVNSVMKKRKAV